MEKKPVVWYAAGRIERDRNRFGLVECSLLGSEQEAWSATPKVVKETVEGVVFAYSGPWTVGCDHGCAHVAGDPNPWANSEMAASYGTGTHGAADNDCSSDTGTGDAGSIVFERSMSGIAKADAVFVWLEDAECYGTLLEIGYAFAMKKPIYLAYAPNVSPNGEMWFAFKAASKIIQSPNARDAFLTAIKYVDGLNKF